MAQPDYILLVYEDAKFLGLDVLVRRVRQHVEPGSSAPLEAVTVHGTGGFKKDVPLHLTKGPARLDKPPAYLIAVADADRPGNLVPGFAGKLDSNEATEEFRLSWQAYLRSEVPAPARPRIECSLIRWSQESLLTSLPEVLVEWAGDKRQQLETHLSKCTPDPRTIADVDFVGSYGDPQQCMKDVVSVVRQEKYNKARHNGAILNIVNGAHIRNLLDRSPDMRTLANILKNAAVVLSGATGDAQS